MIINSGFKKRALVLAVAAASSTALLHPAPRSIATYRTRSAAALRGSSNESPCDCNDEGVDLPPGRSPPTPPHSASSSGSGERKRRKRCVDFPSSAYNRKPRRPITDGGGKSSSSSSSGGYVTPERDGPVDDGSRPPAARVKLAARRNPSDSSSSSSFLPPQLDDIKLAAERTRLLPSRSYARNDSFLTEDICRAPTLDDLMPPDEKPLDGFWAGVPFRALIVGIAYFLFPYLCEFLDRFITNTPAELNELASTYGPGISILYGTFISLTLNILYGRQTKISEDVSAECALLSLVQRQILTIFREDREAAIEGSQCVADQIRTLVRGSRGQELMALMYSDPYYRLLELVEEREFVLMKEKDDLGAQGAVLGSARGVIQDLVKTRAQRLTSEAQALPPTHFFVLSLLTCLLLLGFTVSTLPTLDLEGHPSRESTLLFAFLCGVYILFYNFASDVNNPFDGVYQIRRSTSAAHLLQTKFLIANHPLIGGEVYFDDVEEDSSTGNVQVRAPGLGDVLIEKDGFYPPPGADGNLLE